MLEGGVAVAVRALLVGDAISFVAGDRFLGDSVVFIELSMFCSSRYSDSSQKVLVF